MDKSHNKACGAGPAKEDLVVNSRRARKNRTTLPQLRGGGKMLFLTGQSLSGNTYHLIHLA